MIGGEIPVGWVVNPEAENEIISIIMGYGNLSDIQLACGSLITFVGLYILLNKYYKDKTV